jgi:uncharacterized protein YjbJ (UPF0337 family)
VRPPAPKRFAIVNWGMELSDGNYAGQTSAGRRIGMSGTHKAKNKLDEAAGKAKEKLGQATGDSETEAQGKADQVKSNLKDAGEKVKDAFRK